MKPTISGQVTTAIDLAKLTLRSVAAGLGVPEYLLTGDLSMANYSSLRAALVEFRRRTEQTQFHVLVPQLLNPIWRRWLTVEILAGRIDAPGFDALTLPTAPYALDPGDGCQIGDMFGVSANASLIAEECVLVVEGVFELPKVSAMAIAIGATVYWDDTAKLVTGTASTNLRIGVAVSDAANPSASLNVRLTGP